MDSVLVRSEDPEVLRPPIFRRVSLGSLTIPRVARALHAFRRRIVAAKRWQCAMRPPRIFV